MEAQFECAQCKHKWSGDPSTALGGCTSCGHPYVKWVNFEKWRKQPRLSPEYRKVYPR